MSKGKILYDLRIRAGLSQVEAADKVGISKQTLYKYEKGIVTNIPSDVIEKLADLYNSTPAHIMGWEDTEPEIVFSQDDFMPPEIWEDDELREQLKEFIPMFVHASEQDRDYYMRILKGLQQKP